MKVSTRAALTLFNEKAEKLLGLSFVQKVQSGVEVNISWKRDEPLKATRLGPDPESIDAFVLTIRFFIVGNESSSFRRLAKFTESDELSPGWREKFMEARDFLNKSLDEYPSFQVEINGDKPTRRRILFVMLYGGLAHANDDEMVSAYRLWERDPIALTLLQNEFVIILTQTLKVIAYIAKLNAKEMGTSTG